MSISTPTASSCHRDETYELIEDIVQRNDVEAMKFLRGRLLVTARKKRIPFDLAEEAFQETMLALANNSQNFLQADFPNSYIYTVFFRNISRIAQKKCLPESTWSIGSAEGLQDYRTVEPSLMAERAETRARFNALLPSNEVHARILKMRILEGASHAEIAQATGKEEHYIRGTYSKLSRKILEELGISEDS